MTSYPREIMEFNTWNIFWSISFGILAFIILVGNLFTITIFSKRKLRKRPHFLLISLAIADLLVGLISIPIYVTLHGNYTSQLLRVVFDCIDMLAGLASVFILAAISLERMHAIGWPLHHRMVSTRAYVLAITVPWCLAAMVTSSRLLFYCSIITRSHFVTIIIISLTTPFAITTSCYCFIWKTLKSRLPNPHRNANDEKLSKTLLFLTGSFIVTWLPFEILVVVLNFCVPCRQLPVASVYVIKLLHFSNSLINIIIYPSRIPEFKEALVNLLPSFRFLRQRHQESYHLNSGISVLSMTTILDSFYSLGFDPTEQTSYL